jgi:C-terminal processing protease CtpA/Prc
LTPEIGYIYPGIIKNAYLPKIMEEVKNTRGLIIDMRTYPSDFIVFTLGGYLMPEATRFVKFSRTSNTNPGLFTYYTNLSVGKNNNDYYKGKVVIIVNETTLSQAEYTTMALSVAPGAKVIGSTTAGADGNVSAFTLPGGIRTAISGIGVYYPDGKETQRIGIVPDFVIKPTIKGIVERRDELLEKAIEIINEK